MVRCSRDSVWAFLSSSATKAYCRCSCLQRDKALAISGFIHMHHESPRATNFEITCRRLRRVAEPLPCHVCGRSMLVNEAIESYLRWVTLDALQKLK